MANQAGWNADFESLARQYWAGWNELMRQAGGAQAIPPSSPFGTMGQGFAMPGFGAPGFAMPGYAAVMPGAAGWQEALSHWSRYAQGLAGQRAAPDFGDTLHNTLGRFQQQAGDWYGRMQELAGQLAGQAVGAADIAERWKALLERNGENAWLEMFRALQSPQMHGFDQWYEAVQPMLAGWQNEARSWLGTPTFGLAREHQERLQKLMQAQLDYQDTMLAHNAMLTKSQQQAFANFERKLTEHESPGREITSARALFDLWIDAAEDAFAEMALSADYRETYGAMVNAQMRLRQDVQKEVEHASGLLGMPTRTEIEAAHRKIAELERLMRRMMRGEAPSASRAEPAPRPAVRTPARKAAKRASASHAKAKPVAKKAPARKATTKPASKTTRKAPTSAKPSVAKKAAKRTTKAPTRTPVKRSR